MRSQDWIGTIEPPGHRPGRLEVTALPRLVLRGVESLLVWAERSGQRRQLAELNDHMLRDIGLSRADVMAEITKPFWQP